MSAFDHTLIFAAVTAAVSIVFSTGALCGMWWATSRRDDWTERYPYAGEPGLSAERYDRLRARGAH